MRAFSRRGLAILLLAEPFKQFAIVPCRRVVEDARVDELLQVHSGERVLAKRIVSGLRGGPLPRQPNLVRRPKVPDSCYEQAVQRAGLVGTNENGVLLDNPVDPVICLVFRRRGQVFLAILLAAAHAQEEGQHRKQKSTDRERDFEHLPIVLLRIAGSASRCGAPAFVSASRWCRFGCRSRVRTTASPVSRLGTWVEDGGRRV